jgi:hypothetical protein
VRVGKLCISVDETYLHSTHTVASCWQSEEGVCTVSSVLRGPKLIIIHIGSELGIIPNTLLIFKLRMKAGDCHCEVSFDNFLHWL